MSAISLHTSEHNFEQPLSFLPARWTQQKQQEGEAQQEGAPMSAGLAPEAATVHATEAATAHASGGDGGNSSGSGCPFAGLGRPTLAGNSAAVQRSFMPFSYGPRDCLGQVGAGRSNFNLRNGMREQTGHVSLCGSGPATCCSAGLRLLRLTLHRTADQLSCRRWPTWRARPCWRAWWRALRSASPPAWDPQRWVLRGGGRRWPIHLAQHSDRVMCSLEDSCLCASHAQLAASC